MTQARSTSMGLSFASSGVGSTNHLAAEVFRRAQNIEITNVHYKGGGPAMNDVAGGHVNAMFATLPSALPLIRADKLHALATTGATRSAVLPDVPTLLELGVAQGKITVWAGILGPNGLPPHVTKRLSEEIRKIVTSDAYRVFLKENGAEAVVSTPDEFRSNIRAYRAFWEPVIRDARISVE